MWLYFLIGADDLDIHFIVVSISENEAMLLWNSQRLNSISLIRSELYWEIHIWPIYIFNLRKFLMQEIVDNLIFKNKRKKACVVLSQKWIEGTLMDPYLLWVAVFIPWRVEIVV